MATDVSKHDKRTLIALGVCLILTGFGSAARAGEGVRQHIPDRETVITGELDYQALRSNHGAIRVASSPGGSGAAALELARADHVVIDGTCNSACAWAFIASQNACFTANARFGFHGAFDPGTGKSMPVATGYWLAQVRGSLRGRLEPLQSSRGVIQLSARQMMQHYGDRACGTGGARTNVASR